MEKTETAPELTDFEGSIRWDNSEIIGRWTDEPEIFPAATPGADEFWARELLSTFLKK